MRGSGVGFRDFVVANAERAGVARNFAEIIIVGSSRERIAGLVKIVVDQLGIALQNYMRRCATTQHRWMVVVGGEPTLGGPPQKQADVATCALPRLRIFHVIVAAVDRHDAR